MEVTLLMKEGLCIASGPLIVNNLYKISFTLLYPDEKSEYTFQTTRGALPWEVWYRRMGHIGYDALHYMHRQQLVKGLLVDQTSPIPDCIACIQAKQTVKLFGPLIQRNTTPRELTHINLWGKYNISSINGLYYYLLMIDNATRYTSLAFLKTKDQAGDKLKQCITHLLTHDKIPCALHLDKGSEFLNANLRDWCLTKGIEMQTTAPYSLSQNGVAECMNRTLVELA